MPLPHRYCLPAGGSPRYAPDSQDRSVRFPALFQTKQQPLSACPVPETVGLPGCMPAQLPAPGYPEESAHDSGILYLLRYRHFPATDRPGAQGACPIADYCRGTAEKPLLPCPFHRLFSVPDRDKATAQPLRGAFQSSEPRKHPHPARDSLQTSPAANPLYRVIPAL